MQNEQVNVRSLSGGNTHEGICESLKGRQLRVRLLAIPDSGALETGELVEVSAPETLYLGEINSRQDHSVLIVVEHSLNREALAAIHEVWHRPDGL